MKKKKVSDKYYVYSNCRDLWNKIGRATNPEHSGGEGQVLTISAMVSVL